VAIVEKFASNSATYISSTSNSNTHLLCLR